MLKMYDYINKEIIDEIDVENEFYCIDSKKSENILIVGGPSNKIDQVKNHDFSKQELVMNSSGPYYKIKYDPTGRFVAGASFEDTLQIYDFMTKQMIFCRPKH